MPQFIGFSTIGASVPRSTNIQVQGAANMNTGIGPNGLVPINGFGVTSASGSTTLPVFTGKKFTLTDGQLVMRDLMNALNIRIGEKVGQPGYGTRIWTYIFEPNTPDLQHQLENDIRSIAAADPRLDINYVKSYPQDNGILVEVQFAILPFNNPETLSVFFNQQTNTATLGV
jgi:phage baseplate assembly protein W